MRKPRGNYTREKAKIRRSKQADRQKHIETLEKGEAEEELPETLLPEIFKDIENIYWEVLKSIPDPRNSAKSVYPLHLILHRIISGFISGNKYIGVLFPKKRRKVEIGKKKLGALPTRKPVYQLLRRIDWTEANAILSPLWERLEYTPELVVRRAFRDPKTILDEFEEEKEAFEGIRRKDLAADREAVERSRGMSAAKAKSSSPAKVKNEIGTIKDKSQDTETESPSSPAKIIHNLVVDGKVVRASYNAGVQERFVHVTEIRLDEEGNRSRFIIGARPTELDRKGEWGAAMSVLDALTPLPGDVAVVISGDAGLCVEKFCEWLTEKDFFLQLSREGECR